jgi:hypothetical protein
VYTSLSGSESEKLYHEAVEFHSFRNEASIPIGRLQALPKHLGTTTTLEFWIKEVSHLRRMEYWAIVEIFHGSKVVSVTPLGLL